jgi:hypothetical protein
MRVLWALSCAVWFGCGAGPASTFETDDTPRARFTQPFCVPLSISQAFDAPSRRAAWRDAEVKSYRETTLNPWFDITQELDWSGEVTRYRWDGPGDLNDFNVELQWKWFDGLQRTVPVSIERSYPHDASRSSHDTYSYDGDGRLFRYEHDFVQANFDDMSEEYGFDWKGRLATFKLLRSDPILNRSFHLEYDSAGRIALWGEDYFGQTNYVREEFEYDDFGFLVQWRRRTAEAIQEQVSINWPSEKTAIVYSSRGTFGHIVVQHCP